MQEAGEHAKLKSKIIASIGAIFMKKKNGNSNSKIIPFPNLENRLLDKGMEALKEKRYKEALQILNQFTSYNKNYPEVEVGIAVCLLELGLYEDAKEKCERLLKQDIGDYFNVLEIYITILIQLSEYDEVVSILEVLFEEEKIPANHAKELFHLLEFARKSSDNKMGVVRHNETTADVEKLGCQLVNGNINEQMQAIQNMRTAGTITEIIGDIKKVLLDPRAHPIVQSTALQLLMEKEIKASVVVKKLNRTIKVNPSTLLNIFEEPFTIQVLNQLEDVLGHENPTLFEAVKEAWERFLFVLFPLQPEPLEVIVWAGALHKFGHQLFGMDLSDSEIEDHYGVDIAEINRAIQQIMEVDTIFP